MKTLLEASLELKRVSFAVNSVRCRQDKVDGTGAESKITTTEKIDRNEL